MFKKAHKYLYQLIHCFLSKQFCVPYNYFLCNHRVQKIGLKLFILSISYPASSQTFSIQQNRVYKSDTAAKGFFNSNESDSIPLRAANYYKTNTDSAFRNDTVLIRYRICKNVYIWRYRIEKSKIGNGISDLQANSALPKATDKPFLQINGTLQYDFLYRSYIDTPFAQHDFRQHTIQTYLNILVRDKYPVTLNFSSQQNNSPYFNNLYSLNLQFDPYSYLLKRKQEVLKNVEHIRLQEPTLRMAEAALQKEVEKLNALKAGLTRPDLLQGIVEEREKKYYKELARKSDNPPASVFTPADSLHRLLLSKGSRIIDSAAKKLSDTSKQDSYSRNVDQMRSELDSLRQRVAALQQKTDSLRNLANKKWGVVQQKIYASRNYQEIQKIAIDNGIPTEEKGKVQTLLTHIQSIGIGRSVLNYSELTAWNVPLTGFNIEYASKTYAAFAIGKIDYGFRDFFGKYRGDKNQNFVMGRFGIGDKESRALIFSAFTGRKYSYGSAVTDTGSNYVNIIGYSIEGILKKDENTSLYVEVAKTTKPVSGRVSDNNSWKSLSRFEDLTNVGVSLKGQTVLKATDTKLSAFYRKTGENFQSFSLYSYNTDQTSWHLKAEQSLLKNKVSLVAMLRRNDFLNPFTDKTFKTNTIFKTVQATVRVPKYPLLSVGYYPGSQVYIVNKQKLRENVYYILNSSIIYNYRIGGMQLVSALNLNRYSNKGTDSGFIAYSGSSYMAAQTLIILRLQLQGLYVLTQQEQMKYKTLEGDMDYSLSKAVRVGAGGKYNKILRGDTFWGGRLYLAAEIKPLGRLQVQYEKSYLPTLQKSLFPIETGRITWFKKI